MATLEIRALRKRFGSLEILKGIDISLEQGGFLVLVGPSGCGKSTLLNTIAGLESISSGEILIGGKVVNDLHPSKRDIAMVFQSYALYPNMSVGENIAFGMEMRGVPKPEREKAVAAVAKTLQIEHLLGRRPSQLSGGQRQRVAMGRALVRQPRVFLFDEPLSNLDAALRVQMRLELARLHRELGTTMVYVTHDQVEAMTLADRIVLLRPQAGADGRPSIAQVGAPLELYHRPANRFVAGFIGSPAMNFLPATALAPAGDALSLRIAGQACLADVDASGIAPQAAVTAGIRPEHVQLGDGPLSASVTHVERLGEHAYVYLRLSDGEPLLAKVASERLQVGDSVALQLPARHLHVFAADGGALPRRGADLA